MKFSIVIPCYPAHFKFINRLIKQINAFYVTNNYSIVEIIIAASETDTIAITTESKYPIIMCTTLSKCNAAQNRNRSFSYVTGDWVVFLDCDDIYHYDKIYITYKAICQYPECECVIHSYRYNMHNNFINCIDKFNITSHNDIHNIMFPDNKWHEKIISPGCYNIKLPGKQFPIAHGISTVCMSSPIRFNESMQYGEDGYFCSQHAYANKLIAIDSELMIYIN